MQQRKAEWTGHELIKLCHAGLDSCTLRIEIMKRLRTVIPIDLSFFSTIDPATLLFTGAVMDETLERFSPQFLENEFLQDDVNKCAWMARSNTPVVNLVQATQGKMERSQRYREILAPLALGDELRTVLMANAACWGFMCLHRDRSSPPFSPAEMVYLARLVPHFAEGLRKALLLNSTSGVKAPDEPGLLLLADDLSVAAINAAAERWLEEIGERGRLHERRLPQVISALVARMLALEQGKEVQLNLPPVVRLRTVSGYWLVLHASRLGEPDTHGQIGVIFEVARPAEVAPLIVQAYNLTRRESEIVQSVSHGLSTREIAEKFHISSNTVQDHFKAIFEKVGVRSRRELIGQLFAQHYQPHITEGYNLDTRGWFK